MWNRLGKSLAALLIATHLVLHSFKRRVIYVVAVLYALFSLLYLGRVINSGSLARAYQANIEDFTFPDFGISLGIIRLLVFGIGTVSALYFLIRASKEHRD